MSVDGGENHTAKARLDGFQRAVKRKLSIVRSDHPDWTASIIAAVRAGKCTACVTASNLDLFALYRPLALAGLVSPRDITLASFGDACGIARFFSPIPSLVVADHEAVASEAAKFLLRRLKNPALPVQKFVVKGRLQEGESLGPPPTAIERARKAG